MSSGIPGQGKPYPYWGATYKDTGGGGGGGTGGADLATPVGETSFSASMRNPFGYVTCDGEVFSKTAYPDLYLAIGNGYDGNGCNKNPWCFDYQTEFDFIVPNYNTYNGQTLYKFPTGSPISLFDLSQNVLQGVNGGAQSVTLDVSNIPQHEHQYFQAGGIGGLAGGTATFAGGTFNVGAYTGSVIYDSNNNVIVNDKPAEFSILPTFMRFNMLLRSDELYSSARPGYTTFTTANNKFWMVLLTYTGNLPSPEPEDFSAFAISLPTGNYTRPQVLSNIVKSIKSDINAYGLSNVNVTQCDLSGYAITPQGQWTAKIQMSYNPDAVDVAYGNISFVYGGYANVYGSITQDILDRTADTLGFFTRSYNPGSNGFISSSNYNFNNYGGALSYIVPPKAMKINWNGSIANNDFNLSLFSNINTFIGT